MRLYQIAPELEALTTQYEELLSENQGEVTPEVEALEQRLKDYFAASEDKIEAAAMVLKNLEAESIAIDHETRRLVDRQHSIDRNYERLKALTLFAVDAMGGKVKTKIGTVGGRDNPPSYTVEVDPDVDQLALAKCWPEFFRVSVEPNKREIINENKGGRNIPAVTVTLNPKTRHLRIW